MTAAERRQLARIRSVEELRAYLKQCGPKAKKLSALRAHRISSEKSRRSAKNAETAAIWHAVNQRAIYEFELCECGCGVRLGDDRQLDHYPGRAKGQSVDTCWMLNPWCHRDKTNNYPSTAHWNLRWRAHCGKHGYPCKTRIAHAPVARRRA